MSGREPAVPDDFLGVLDAVPGARTGWDLLTPEERTAYVSRLEAAHDPADRERRIDESVQELTQQLRGRPRA